MSLDFKLQFDENKESTQPQDQETVNADRYLHHGNTRNLAFVWPDGRMEFFNYSYLVRCAYDPAEGSIVLEFTSHTVALKGYRLEILAVDLMAQLPRIVRCIDSRYIDTLENDAAVVSKIIITEKA